MLIFLLITCHVSLLPSLVEQGQPGAAIESDASSESDADVYTDGCGSPRMQRRRRHKVFRAERVDRSMTFRTLDELMFDDNLPEVTQWWLRLWLLLLLIGGSGDVVVVITMVEVLDVMVIFFFFSY